MSFKNSKQRAAFFALQKKMEQQGKIVPKSIDPLKPVKDPLKDIDNKFKKLKQSLKIIKKV